MTGSTYEKPVHVGVIGGSGLYKLDNLTKVAEVNPKTPWGYPSSPITISLLPSGAPIAFVARHGVHHNFTPSSVPVLANIAALKSLGVRAILAFSAVGSLREEIAPGDFIIPDQIIDRTKGVRRASFFGEGEESGVVAHASFGDPFSAVLRDIVKAKVAETLSELSTPVKLHQGKTVVCMEGPQFSTRAESLMYRSWGGDIINMSVLPEAKLAREAEMSYVLIATATDYDAWRPSEESVTVAEVVKTLTANALASKVVAEAVIDMVHEAADDNSSALFKSAKGSMRWSIITKKEAIPAKAKANLAYVLPEYFS